jgi:hypothetical protein
VYCVVWERELTAISVRNVHCALTTAGTTEALVESSSRKG